MIPADLTPSELAQKMEARWELLESMFQRIFDSIEDAKVLTPCFTFIHAKTKRSELQVCLENRCDMQERRFELVENAVQQIQATILFFSTLATINIGISGMHGKSLRDAGAQVRVD